MGIGSTFSKIQKTFSSGGLNLLPSSPEGGGDSGDEARAEEARKAALRRKIDKLYGIGSATPGTEAQVDPETGTVIKPGTPGTSADDDPEAAAARAAMEGETTKLADATRAYYTDQLGRGYEKAERGTRFKLARQGLLGSSEDVYQQGQVASDRDMGATRVDDAVRRAVAQLTGQREQERLSAVNLVNAGAGDSAVSAAQAGIRNSLENVSSAQKQDIFGDLFTSATNAGAAANENSAQAAFLSRYRNPLNSFFLPTRTTSGKVTAS